MNDYRNPLLAEAMKVMGFVNKFNRGIAKVRTEMEKNGNPAPVFDVNKLTEFRVTLMPSFEPPIGAVDGDITSVPHPRFVRLTRAGERLRAFALHRLADAVEWLLEIVCRIKGRANR